MPPLLFKDKTMTTERIQELIEKRSLTATEKAEILTAADELGIEVNVKKGCRACYEKAAVAVFEAMRKDRPPVLSVDGWRLKRPGDSFRCGGLLVNESTLPNIVVGMLNRHVIAAYFVKDGENLIDKLKKAKDGQGGEI